MTNQDIRDAIETFARYGVPKDRIFNEVMRARYLDYVLFLKPENKEYGVSIEDLYKNMEKTAEKLGMYEGDADTYVKAYTLALRVEPMVFAPNLPPSPKEVQAIIEEAISTAKEESKTVLFTGIDHYLPYISSIFKKLATQRVAVELQDSSWKSKIQLLFPRGRVMDEEILAHDEEKYDYIFNFETVSMAHADQLTHLLAENGKMDLLVSNEVLVKEGEEEKKAKNHFSSLQTLHTFYDVDIAGKEYAFLRFGKEQISELSFGEAAIENEKFKAYPEMKVPTSLFQEAEDWNYDVYLFNSIIPIQTILSGNVLQMEHQIGSHYYLLKKEVCEEEFLPILGKQSLEGYSIYIPIMPSNAKGKLGIVAQKGDLVIAEVNGLVKTVVLEEPYLVTDDILVLRSFDEYTTYYLKLFLDGPVGELFLSTMKAGNHMHLTPSRLLRIPLPKAERKEIDEITSLCIERMRALEREEKAWQEAKIKSVGLMMGHGEF